MTIVQFSTVCVLVPLGQILLRNGANVEVTADDDRSTTLMWASWNGLTETVQELIVRGKRRQILYTFWNTRKLTFICC